MDLGIFTDNFPNFDEYLFLKELIKKIYWRFICQIYIKRKKPTPQPRIGKCGSKINPYSYMGFSSMK